MPDPAAAVRKSLTPGEVFNLAYAAVEAGRTEEGERLYRLVLQMAPIRAATINLGLVFERQERIEDAEALYCSALAEDPEDLLIRRHLAFLLLRGVGSPKAGRSTRRGSSPATDASHRSATRNGPANPCARCW